MYKINQRTQELKVCIRVCVNESLIIHYQTSPSHGVHVHGHRHDVLLHV